LLLYFVSIISEFIRKKDLCQVNSLKKPLYRSYASPKLLFSRTILVQIKNFSKILLEFILILKKHIRNSYRDPKKDLAKLDSNYELLNTFSIKAQISLIKLLQLHIKTFFQLQNIKL
jgi:hypothetical protein